MILLAIGVVLVFAFLYIIKLRRDYYREFIAGVPLRFYKERETSSPVEDII
jgi:hypothetical protein